MLVLNPGGFMLNQWLQVVQRYSSFLKVWVDHGEKTAEVKHGDDFLTSTAMQEAPQSW